MEDLTKDSFYDFSSDASIGRRFKLEINLTQVSKVSSALHDEHVAVIILGAQNMLIRVVSLPFASFACII